MQIDISGHQMSAGEALERHVKNHINKDVKKFFNQATSCKVIFEKEANHFKTSITINDGSGTHQHISAQSEASDAYDSFNNALKASIKQLKDLKDKLKSHKSKSKEKLKDDMLAS